MASLQEELRFLHYPVRRIRIVARGGILVRSKEILRELAPHERIEEQLRVVELLAEMLHDATWVFFMWQHLPVEQRRRCVQHGLKGGPGGGFKLAAIQV